MKRVIVAILWISIGAIGAIAEETNQVVKTEAFTAQEWPSLNELWNETASANDFKKAFVNGTLDAEILLGYEYSNLRGNTAKPANALISRTTVNYLTGDFRGFSGFVQAQYVGPINDHYNDTTGGNTQYDVVADPETFRFHQAYLAYSGYETIGRIGAQEIILDNARFIGDVGWRLNQQSFNAGSVANHSVSNLTLFYAYADSINTIFGNTQQTRQYHMLNAEYKVGENNKVSGYAYLQRNDNSAANSKVDTYGLRTWGKNGQISHDAFLALQRDAYYGSLFGEMAIKPVNVGAGIEYISGGNRINERFQTLNGTAHKFNGWADQFLGTGGGLAGGLIDLYGQVSARPVEKLKLMAVYHYFNTANKTTLNNFSGQYGQELDLLATYPLFKNVTVLAKFAYYKKGDNNPDNFTNDETVFWLRGTLTF